jgi:hypothetical protein
MKEMIVKRMAGFCLCLALLLCLGVHARAESATCLEAGFQNPPDSAKPHTWWHWMNGFVSKDGITKDLEAMKAVGLGGFQLFDVGRGPAGPVMFHSPEYHELIAFAFAEADRLELEAGFHNSSGWSSTGGPWITPENSMKALVWSEVTVRDGETVVISLPVPELPEGRQKRPQAPKTDFYEDIVVLAFPTPADTDYRIRDWSDKALVKASVHAAAFEPDLRTAPAAAVIPSSEIVDVSAHLDALGRLNWQPPAGDWTIMRIGYTSTRTTNHPATPAGVGLEVDKLSRSALDAHWAALLDKIIAAARDKPALTTLLIDSYEVGMQNWTEGFEKEFARRRGYDLLPWLPAVTGRVLDNTETSERVLWDLRTTIAELMQENYFGYFAEKCHAHGLKLAIEPYGNGMFDAPAIAQIADLPITEFWQGDDRPLWQWTTHVAASGAHLSGRSVVGAEAFTSMSGDWKAHPYTLKQIGDLAFARGVNRFYFHTFAHQPWNEKVKPGMTMYRFGGNFHRNNTWFPKAGAWMTYIARCQFLLQSGAFQADVLVLYGDERGFNNFLADEEPVDVPDLPGLRFDLGGMGSLGNLSVDSEGDLRVAHRGGKLDTRYRLLLLKRADLMTPAHVATLGRLADQGAKIFAPRPLRSPSLHDHTEADETLQNLVRRYWDTERIRDPSAFPAAVAALAPDCEVPAGVVFHHRRLGTDDLYFIANQEYEARDVSAVFRVSGRQPELWNPLTGEISRPANWESRTDGRTEVNLELGPVDSLFVVFRQPADDGGSSSDAASPVEYLKLTNPWTVTFDPEFGPEQPVVFKQLQAWDKHPDPAIKHFSGTATCQTTFDLASVPSPLILDLGGVNVMAQVRLNGHDLGTLWKPPFRIDISKVAQPGVNQLEVTVTNLWVNRLIGDDHLPEFDRAVPDWLTAGQPIPPGTPRKTFASFTHQKKSDRLLPSGLTGPVTLWTTDKPRTAD